MFIRLTRDGITPSPLSLALNAVLVIPTLLTTYLQIAPPRFPTLTFNFEEVPVRGLVLTSRIPPFRPVKEVVRPTSAAAPLILFPRPVTVTTPFTHRRPGPGPAPRPLSPTVTHVV